MLDKPPIAARLVVDERGAVAAPFSIWSSAIMYAPASLVWRTTFPMLQRLGTRSRRSGTGSAEAAVMPSAKLKSRTRTSLPFGGAATARYLTRR